MSRSYTLTIQRNSSLLKSLVKLELGEDQLGPLFFFLGTLATDVREEDEPLSNEILKAAEQIGHEAGIEIVREKDFAQYVSATLRQ